MEKRWELLCDTDRDTINNLSQSLEIPTVIARILVQRGFTTSESASAFFHPDRAALHDPFQLDGMNEAVERIAKALQNRERIFIYGDYDVDGITSVSLLYLFFRDLGGDVRYYIPNRQNEGYGISIKGIECAKEEGAQLIITVDCGITSVEEVNRSNELGLDIIISDHHQPGPETPNALAVINPKLTTHDYPFKELAGVGVAYKLAQGVCRHMELDPNYLDRYLDLVAVGTAADIVPLVDENRIFVRLGLKKINADPLVGIRTLIETANLRFGQIDVNHIIYGLAPRINAVGRLGSADSAVELMITQDTPRALHLAQILERENRYRKEIDTHTLDEALQQVHEYFDPVRDRAIVLAKENWHSGVIGIVASRLIERYYRPTVMITVEEGIGKGSARSIPGFDIYGALQEVSELLDQFGGHTYAAGLSLKAEQISEFRRRLNQVADERLSDDDLVPKLKIDSELDLQDVNENLMQILKMFAPFGPNNPMPIFVSKNVALSGYPRIVGSNHLKFQVKRNGRVLDCIGFNLGDRISRLDPIRPTNHIVYTVEENDWGGTVSIQLRIKDVRGSDI